MAKKNGLRQVEPATIRSVTVSGFKSLAKPQTLTIRPLTVLAGANSSGKSSIMQPLLLMKQTLEHPVDEPGLITSGPIVDLGVGKDLLTRNPKEKKQRQTFNVSFELSSGGLVELVYAAAESGSLMVREQRYRYSLSGVTTRYRKGKSAGSGGFIDDPTLGPYRGWMLKRLAVGWTDPAAELVETRLTLSRMMFVSADRSLASNGLGYSGGGFERLVGRIVGLWQEHSDRDKTHQLNQYLSRLRFATHVEAKKVATQEFELRLSRTLNPRWRSSDTVPLPLVGSGPATALPVLAALISAGPGDIVYIQEPEKHLHPAAQRTVAQILCEVSRHGSSLIVETHSSLILREIQTQVAADALNPADVALHWFTRGPESGYTSVQLAGLDENGAYGDWPIDFDEVLLDSEASYLDAASRKSS